MERLGPLFIARSDVACADRLFATEVISDGRNAPPASRGLFDYEADHICFSVPDLDASIAWYREVLGFEVNPRFHVKDVPADGAMLQRNRFRVELFSPMARPLCLKTAGMCSET